MDFTVVPFAAQPVQRWANGGGLTRQVAIDPPESSLATGFRWRISRARIERDGPFSRLPGVDRVLWVLSGAPLRLREGDREHVLRPHAEFRFAGERNLEAVGIGAPVDDLNVMTARGAVKAAASLRQMAAGARLTLAPAPQRVVVALAGEPVTAAGNQLAAGDAMVVTGGGALELTAGAEVLVMTVQFSDGAGAHKVG